MIKRYLYIGYDDTSWGFKIGITNNIIKRQDELRNTNPSFVMLLDFEVDNAWKLEKELHKKYADKRVSGEWFELSAQDVVDIAVSINPNHPVSADSIRTATGRQDI